MTAEHLSKSRKDVKHMTFKELIVFITVSKDKVYMLTCFKLLHFFFNYIY